MSESQHPYFFFLFFSGGGFLHSTWFSSQTCVTVKGRHSNIRIILKEPLMLLLLKSLFPRNTFYLSEIWWYSPFPKPLHKMQISYNRNSHAIEETWVFHPVKNSGGFWICTIAFKALCSKKPLYLLFVSHQLQVEKYVYCQSRCWAGLYVYAGDALTVS